jgi:hypothetical protein
MNIRFRNVNIRDLHMECLISREIFLESNPSLSGSMGEGLLVWDQGSAVSHSASSTTIPRQLEFRSVVVWTGHQLPLYPIIYVQVSLYGNRPNKTVLPAHLTPVELLYWFRCWGTLLGIQTAFMEQVLKHKMLPAYRNCTTVAHTCRGIQLTLFTYPGAPGT